MCIGEIVVMVNIRKDKLDDKIRFKVWDINTICPHRKYDREDHTELEIVYMRDVYEISEVELEEYIENNIEGKEIAMEMIPLEILSYCVENTAMRKPGRRYAAPKEVQIISISKGMEAKKWAMTVNVKFNREILGSARAIIPTG